MPPTTLDAVRDHGVIRPSLEEDVDGARRTLAALTEAGISLEAITADLLTDAVRLFEEPFRKLLAVIDDQLRARGPAADSQMFSVPAAIRADVEAAVDDWQARGSSRRLWARDAGLWTGGDENSWLGWLNVAEQHDEHVAELRRVAAAFQAARLYARTAAGHGRLEPLPGGPPPNVRATGRISRSDRAGFD